MGMGPAFEPREISTGLERRHLAFYPTAQVWFRGF
jgi:hypothetical protein